MGVGDSLKILVTNLNIKINNPRMESKTLKRNLLNSSKNLYLALRTDLAPKTVTLIPMTMRKIKENRGWGSLIKKYMSVMPVL